MHTGRQRGKHAKLSLSLPAEKFEPSERLAQCNNMYGHMTSSLMCWRQQTLRPNKNIFKINILVGTSMYTHDRACACTRRTPLSVTSILGANIISCKPQNLENVGLAGQESESSEEKVSI